MVDNQKLLGLLGSSFLLIGILSPIGGFSVLRTEPADTDLFSFVQSLFEFSILDVGGIWGWGLLVAVAVLFWIVLIERYRAIQGMTLLVAVLMLFSAFSSLANTNIVIWDGFRPQEGVGFLFSGLMLLFSAAKSN